MTSEATDLKPCPEALKVANAIEDMFYNCEYRNPCDQCVAKAGLMIQQYSNTRTPELASKDEEIKGLKEAIISCVETAKTRGDGRCPFCNWVFASSIRDHVGNEYHREDCVYGKLSGKCLPDALVKLKNQALHSLSKTGKEGE